MKHKHLHKIIPLLLCLATILTVVILLPGTSASAASVSKRNGYYYDENNYEIINLGEVRKFTKTGKYSTVVSGSWSVSGALKKTSSSRTWIKFYGTRAGIGTIRGSVRTKRVVYTPAMIIYGVYIPAKRTTQYNTTTYTYKVRVINPNVSFTLPKTMRIKIGAKVNVNNYIKGSVYARKIANVAYTSYNKNILKYASDGVYVAKKAGTVTLRLRTKNLKSNKSASCKITVYDPTLPAPQIKKMENVSSGTKITWGKVSGAVKYRVFIKSGGSWKKLADTKSTSYINTKVSTGKRYYYTVRCISADGKTFTGRFNSIGKSCVYIAPPKIKSFTDTASGTKIIWGKVNGAAKYRVFVKSGSSWKKLADTKSTSYIHKTTAAGKTFRYTVRCLSADGKSFTSAFSNTGWSHKTPSVAPTKITVSRSSVTVTKGYTCTLTATVYPANANNKTVKWTSSNSAVATVSNGVVTGKGAGTAVITAETSNGKKATCTVTVVPAPTSVSLNKTSAALTVGSKVTLTATVSPSNAYNKTITWSSSNSTVASVSGGVVTAKSTGTATIYAETFNGIYAYCTVTVKAIEPSSVELNTGSASMTVGDQLTLTATVYPANAGNKTVTWSSSKSGVASVSGGVVTANSAGTAVITAKTSNGKIATCTITVKDLDYLKIDRFITSQYDGYVVAQDGCVYSLIDGVTQETTASGLTIQRAKKIDLGVKPAPWENSVTYSSYFGWYIVTSDHVLYNYKNSVLTWVMNNVQSVYVAYSFAGAVTTSGDLYMWGNNYYGQLGIGDINLNVNGVSAPTKVLSDVKAVSLGGNHSSALLNNGDLYMWGRNTYGELTDACADTEAHLPTMVMSGVKDVQLGFDFSAALKEDGSLYTWGNNIYGQLGSGSYVSSSVPFKVRTGVKEFSAGDNSMASLTESGYLYTWGFHNGRSSSSSPSPGLLRSGVKSIHVYGDLNIYIDTSGNLYLYSFVYANASTPTWYQTVTPKKMNYVI